MHLALRIILQAPPKLTYALQKGSGNNYETVQVQRSAGDDLHFKLEVEIKGTKQANDLPDFKGPFVQGPALSRFIYLDIGSYAGAHDWWSGRLKIPLIGITWRIIDELIAQPSAELETKVPGIGKNGGPNCATVKPFDGWKVKSG
jgi:hypothetical protein